MTVSGELRTAAALIPERASVSVGGGGGGYLGRLRLKRDGTLAETRFRLSAKRTSPFKSAGVSIHSIAGNRGVASSVVTLDRPSSEVV